MTEIPMPTREERPVDSAGDGKGSRLDYAAQRIQIGRLHIENELCRTVPA